MMMISLINGGTQKLHKIFKIDEALEEHFLVARLVFLIQPFLGENAFSEFFSKNLGSPYRVELVVMTPWL
jgi:hypothetical protein